MSDRPKPPEGFDSWLDAHLAELDPKDYFPYTGKLLPTPALLGPNGREVLRAELAELRTKLESQEKEIERLRGVMRNPPKYVDCNCGDPDFTVCNKCLAKLAEPK